MATQNHLHSKVKKNDSFWQTRPMRWAVLRANWNRRQIITPEFALNDSISTVYFTHYCRLKSGSQIRIPTNWKSQTHNLHIFMKQENDWYYLEHTFCFVPTLFSFRGGKYELPFSILKKYFILFYFFCESLFSETCIYIRELPVQNVLNQ